MKNIKPLKRKLKEGYGGLHMFEWVQNAIGLIKINQKFSVEIMSKDEIEKQAVDAYFECYGVQDDN